ncbi:probable LRR receptor-like serine/threonine-protein kinase RKF3 [Elaeis guineensis]|uniref:non-specific serine/threonine protein kinase n=1 Tax=Elaeis guineensis var. tenera TaxID=51953 RepID=A0A6I9QWH1_ELAGV|nr:probable LRR receptor-like serine/threonine-protein kinase RKF3 [Elaeis guineensis]
MVRRKRKTPPPPPTARSKEYSFSSPPMTSLPLSVFFLSCCLLLGFVRSQNSSCPLDFSVLQKFIPFASVPSGTADRCSFVLETLHLVLAEYLRTAGLFLPPVASAAACWSSLNSALSPVLPSSFSLPSSCGFQPSWISEGCMNITTRAAFEAVVTTSGIREMAQSCNQSLLPVPTCTACTASLSNVKAAYLTGAVYGNVTDCTAYTFIYAAGVVNHFGPTDDGTAFCIFLLNYQSSSSGGGSTAWIFGVAAGCLVVVLLAVLAAWWFWRRRRERLRRRRRKSMRPESRPSLAMESIGASTTLIKFTFDDIKEATKNFSRDNIIGRGGYGNVYKGLLPDGSEVALKRFKNCSGAGDASFAHEVEVIASVRHVNLVALRGYCTATTPLEGHQRIIVCDLMRNGSLHDHLFGSGGARLSWPIRQRIAVGTARGLAYLHYGAQPAIIHRDIKASNILLDEMFEAKVADFGLAKFAPEGMSHVSTMVAGTMGYVAPEYALYGQLTEKSDVFSFGVVLLELLSGKKAFVSLGEGQAFLVTDWAWSLVRKGKTLDVIEEGMEELGPKEVLEKYVLVAVLSTHPQLHARPSMDQIVKILETDSDVPSIPDRPLSIMASREDIERSASSSGSGQLSSLAGFQMFTPVNDDANSDGPDAV